MKKLNYTEDLLRVIFFWIGTFFLVSGILSFLGILKPAVNSGIQNPDMLGTVFSITGSAFVYNKCCSWNLYCKA